VEHQPTKIVGNKPITIGQGFGTLAWIPEGAGRLRRALGLRLGPKAQSSRWALPLLHEWITSAETPIEKGSSQLRRVCEKLPVRPISLWDSGYGNAAFVNESADIPADKIIRLRPNICLWGPLPPYSGRGRPRVHGGKASAERFAVNAQRNRQPKRSSSKIPPPGDRPPRSWRWKTRNWAGCVSRYGAIFTSASPPSTR